MRLKDLRKQIGPAYFYREALAVALPVMLQQLIMSMVSLIDNFMVAGLGDTNMAAVNVSNQVNFIYIVIVNTFCSAGGIYLAQFNGAKDSPGMKNAFRFKVLFTMVIALLYFLCCHLIPRPMLAMMTMGNAAQEGIIDAGETYIRLIAWTLIPIALSSAMGTSFREMGRPTIPLIFSAIATGVNTLGNWILIYGHLGAPAMGVRGAAIATIIARIFEMLCFIIYLGLKAPPFAVGIGNLFHVDWSLFRTILSKSGMIFVSELSWVSSETIITALYNGRGGAETVAGMAAGYTIGNIFFLLFGGIQTAGAVVIGGTLGAGKLDEARRRAVWLKSGALIGGTIIMILVALFSLIVIPLAFMNLTAQARRITFGMVTILLLYMPLWALLNSLFAISRAGGDAAMGMWADLIVNNLLFIPGAFLLAFLTSIGPVAMFALLKTTDFIKYQIARHLLNKERWVQNLTVRA